MENEIEKIIRQNVDIHDEDCKSGYIIGAFYIKELINDLSGYIPINLVIDLLEHFNRQGNNTYAIKLIKNRFMNNTEKGE